MATIAKQPATRWPGWHTIFWVVLLFAIGGLLWGALVWLRPTGPETLNLGVGTVAPIDINAPFSITYESQVLTEQQREAAARSVPPVYTPPDTHIARQQVDKLRAALAFITATRADSYASFEQKLADLALLDVDLMPDTAEKILSLNSDQWQTVQQEAVLVLQQVMRSTIREGQLADARRNIPNLVSFSLPEDQAEIVAELVSLYVAPNSFYSEELTEEKRQQVREAIRPVTRSFLRGETVVRRGKVLSEADLEALQYLGLLPGEDNARIDLSAFVLVVLTMGFTMLYLYRQPSLWNEWRFLCYIGVFFFLFLFTARLLILGHTILPFLYPVAGFGILLAALFGSQPGMVLSLPLSLLITYGMPNALEVTVYYLLSTFFGIMMLGRGQRVLTYFWAGLGSAVMGANAILAFRLSDPFTDLIGLLLLSGTSLSAGIASGILGILLQLVSAPLIGKVTVVQLMELSRPDHPLLRFILLNAPGTYQHSLQVANLAEQAAEQIGADPLLTRVGALYHDAGKALNPQFFIENHVPGTPNPHDALSPEESAAIIIAHVPDGLKLARKHRLPDRLLDFIAEHHGTMLTRYQYAQAVQAAGGDASLVDEERFRYPGPRPQTRETALVMIADGCEARARAERPANEAELARMIKDVIDKRLASGQLDETTLTTRDLISIQDSFTATLKGIYHPRIAYPKLEQETASVHEAATQADTEESEPAPASPLPIHDSSSN